MTVNTIILILLKYVLIFSMGTVTGWFVELFWRRYFGGARRWINPGFLNGPWLPLYGFGFIALYLICLPEWPITILAPVFFIVLTVLEYMAGLIFIGHFKIKLWDYSKSWGNIKGLVCPLYSFFWMLLGLFFYFLIYPNLQDMVNTLYQYLELSFILGLYGGLFAADVWHSFNLAARIRTFVNETEERWPVDFERLKLELRDRVQEGFINRTHFFLPFNGELGITFKERLKKHRPNLSRTLDPLKDAIDKRIKKD